MYKVPAAAGENCADSKSKNAAARTQRISKVDGERKKARRSSVATSCMRSPPWVKHRVGRVALVAVTCSDRPSRSAGFPTDLTKCIARGRSKSQESRSYKCRHVQTCEVGDIIEGELTESRRRAGTGTKSTGQVQVLTRRAGGICQHVGRAARAPRAQSDRVLAQVAAGCNCNEEPRAAARSPRIASTSRIEAKSKSPSRRRSLSSQCARLV